MLTKIILKMLLKATIPVVIIAGVMSYGMYMRGGDPAGLFRQLAGNSARRPCTNGWMRTATHNLDLPRLRGFKPLPKPTTTMPT